MKHKLKGSCLSSIGVPMEMVEMPKGTRQRRSRELIQRVKAPRTERAFQIYDQVMAANGGPGVRSRLLTHSDVLRKRVFQGMKR